MCERTYFTTCPCLDGRDRCRSCGGTGIMQVWAYTRDDDLIPGVDYEVACCPICGRSDAHAECDEFIGPYPARSYPHHDEDDE